MNDVIEYQPSDVLTLNDALTAAILGYNVRAVDMAEGTFVRYDFNGFRIHHAGGASSGWTRRDHDETVDWHVLPDEHYDAYKRTLEQNFDAKLAEVAKAQKWGRVVPVAEPPVNDVLIIGDNGKWGLTKPSNEEAPKRDKWGRTT